MAEEDTIEESAEAIEPMDLDTAIRLKVLSKDRRFELPAYLFIYEALGHTQHALGRDVDGLNAAQRHVSGQELLEGIRNYAKEQFGPLAPTVFRSWGIRRASDFGELVFNLVENGLLGKTENDSRADFAGGFDLDAAFEGPIEVKLN